MSTILVVLPDRAPPAATLMALHRLTAQPVQALRARLAADGVVAAYALFGNNHDEAAATLRRLVAEIPGIALYERVDATMGPPAPHEAITPAVLFNILARG